MEPLNLRTLSYYRKVAEYRRKHGEDTVSLNLFFELLSKADQLHQDKERLIEKIMDIEEIIEQTREIATPFKQNINQGENKDV